MTVPEQSDDANASAYGPWTTRRPQRGRRTPATMADIRAAIYGTTEAERPVTVRRVFYVVASMGLIEKTDLEYKRTIVRLLLEMRRDGTIPHEWIADHARWIQRPRAYDSVAEALCEVAATYRRRLWTDQDAYLEIWTEKDALTDVLYGVTAPWDVPLVATRGYCSESYLYAAASGFPRDRPTFIYYLGDYDPSGVNAQDFAERRLCELAPDCDIHVTRVAVTAEQIARWGLPTRPTKGTDPRTKRWTGGASVELDAIPPADLRALVEQAILSHVDLKKVARIRQEEAEEQAALDEFISTWTKPGA